MPQEALLYILCENKIKSYSWQFKMDLEMAAMNGVPWSEEETSKWHAGMMKEATKEWAIKVSKVLPLLSPEFDDLVTMWAELYLMTNLNKRDKKPNAIVFTMDHASLFTVVSTHDAKLQSTLIVAHCRPYLRKQFFYPHSVNDERVKQWCHTWYMWNKVKGIAIGMLRTALMQVGDR